jgi:hypothetical protein
MGNVKATFAWTPSTLGEQWVDVSLLNNGFTSGWINSGALSPFQYTASFDILHPNATHYSRVNTWTAAGWQPSETIAFRTISCFTPPTNVGVYNLSPSSARFVWNRGVDNHWFCLDTARSANDLLSFAGSWGNHGCGMSQTILDVQGLQCGADYYWRVYSVGNGGSGHSQATSFRTADCPFTPAHNLRAKGLSGDSIRFDWSRGVNNTWFCVDTATRLSDLHGFAGSWKNFGCGTTATTVTASGLNCNTLYYWRVYAVGGQGSAHSEVAMIKTASCATTEKAPIDNAQILVQESFPPKYVLRVVAGLPGGCAKPHSHDIERSGTHFRVEILNSISSAGPCLDIYNTYNLSIPLPGTFQPGVDYTVNVNGQVLSFKGQ